MVTAPLRDWFQRRNLPTYGRRVPLILINGLAEQAESWFRNQNAWHAHFDVHMPNLLVYDGAALHQRIDAGLPIDINYLVDQLHLYLESFVQTGPCHLVASSLGGKIAVEYAVRHPQNVSRMVLICPSGMGDQERLPIIEGVRRSDIMGLVDSVFHDRRKADPRLFDFYRQRFADKRWRVGLLRTIRGTMDHMVRDLLPLVSQPTLFLSGREDRIVDPNVAEQAARRLPMGRFVSLPNCGHAPQQEMAQMVNRLVVDFLTNPALESSAQPCRPLVGEPSLAS